MNWNGKEIPQCDEWIYFRKEANGGYVALNEQVVEARLRIAAVEKQRPGREMSRPQDEDLQLLTNLPHPPEVTQSIPDLPRNDAPSASQDQLPATGRWVWSSSGFPCWEHFEKPPPSAKVRWENFVQDLKEMPFRYWIRFAVGALFVVLFLVMWDSWNPVWPEGMSAHDIEIQNIVNRYYYSTPVEHFIGQFWGSIIAFLMGYGMGGKSE